MPPIVSSLPVFLMNIPLDVLVAARRETEVSRGLAALAPIPCCAAMPSAAAVIDGASGLIASETSRAFNMTVPVASVSEPVPFANSPLLSMKSVPAVVMESGLPPPATTLPTTLSAEPPLPVFLMLTAPPLLTPPRKLTLTPVALLIVIDPAGAAAVSKFAWRRPAKLTKPAELLSSTLTACKVPAPVISPAAFRVNLSAGSLTIELMLPVIVIPPELASAGFLVPALNMPLRIDNRLPCDVTVIASLAFAVRFSPLLPKLPWMPALIMI